MKIGLQGNTPVRNESGFAAMITSYYCEMEDQGTITLISLKVVFEASLPNAQAVACKSLMRFAGDRVHENQSTKAVSCDKNKSSQTLTHVPSLVRLHFLRMRAKAAATSSIEISN